MKKRVIIVTMAYCVKSMQCNLAGAGLKNENQGLEVKRQ